jgi:protein O-mannosyl-transferase
MGKSSAKKKGRKAHEEIAAAKIQPSKPAAQAPAVKGAGRKWYLLLAAVLLVTFACYANSLNNAFVFDDALLLTDNLGIRGIENIPWILGLTTGVTFYRPVRMITYAIDYTLNKKLWCHIGDYEGPDKGMYPLGYHISNIFYHILTSLVVFLLVTRLAGNPRVGILAAGFFALHPVHTDSVAYLSGRRDILFTLFYLAGFYFFLAYQQSKKLIFSIACFLAYGLSLGSKEMAVTFPALLLCYDTVGRFSTPESGLSEDYTKRLFNSLRKSISQAPFCYLFLFLVSLSFCYYKIFINSPSYQETYYGDSILINFSTVGEIVVHYLHLLLYPVNLIADYSYNAFPLSASLFEPATLFAFLLLGVILYVLLRLLATRALIAFGGIWFFLTLLPVCHIIPHHELLAEHYLYLPSVGFCLVAAVLCDGLMRDKKCHSFVFVCCIAILIFFSLRVVDRNRDWRNSLTLYDKTVKTVPECARANANLCEAYTNEGRFDEALSACKRALDIKPDQLQAINNLGTVYARKGMMEEAITSYKNALVLRPGYEKGHFNLGLLLYQKGDLEGAIREYEQALAIRPYFVEARNNLGIAFSAKGRFDEAISQYKQALWFNPYYADAYYNLGIACAKTGETDKAVDAYRRALDINPNYTSARINLAGAYMKKGEIDNAITELDKAVAGNPDSGDAYFNLGYAYSQKGDLTGAIDSYKLALANGPERADVHSNLGNIYLQQGRFDEAITEYQRALSLQENFSGAHNNLAMAYFRKKDYAKAIKHCDRAAELGLSNPALLRDLQPYR